MMDLSEWAKIHLKHQDLLKREIESIELDGSVLLVHKKSGQEEWLLEPELGLHNLDSTGIITLNTKSNLKTLLASWKMLSCKHLKIIFANPKTNEKWVLVPDHHARIADEKSLKAGLEAMFTSITEA